MTTATQSLGERFDPKLLAALEGLDFKARYVVEGFLSGMHDSPFHGFSVEFSDYRNYQPGDDLRHVDWRLYARTDRLCIKRYMQETKRSFLRRLRYQRLNELSWRTSLGNQAGMRQGRSGSAHLVPAKNKTMPPE
jgi:hypothetical protein